MASISREPNGRKVLQFCTGAGRRRSLRLGKLAQRDAETFRLHVERLVAAKERGAGVPADTFAWARRLDAKWYQRLVRVGLLEPRAATTLGAFLTTYLDGRVDWKPATRAFYGHTARNLREHFGSDKRLDEITAGAADEWKSRLAELDLSRNTILRRCTAAATIFRGAVRRKLIVENPFVGLGGLVQRNRERMAFISESDARRVLEACPSATWRAAFALARWGGLRVPSELVQLRWQDVNWDTGRFTVRATKTEHNRDQGIRLVPLFPEVRGPLLELFEAAADGAVAVFPPTWTATTNLRKGLTAVIERAGLKTWPKLWQNLRATRETELFEKYPAHIAVEWIGNSVAIALRHYTQSREVYYEQAAAGGALHNPVQQVYASACRERCDKISETHKPVNCVDLRIRAAVCDLLEAVQMGVTGLELGGDCSWKTDISQARAAQSGAVAALVNALAALVGIPVRDMRGGA